MLRLIGSCVDQGHVTHVADGALQLMQSCALQLMVALLALADINHWLTLQVHVHVAEGVCQALSVACAHR